MKAKHRRTLEAIFATPTRAGIVFSDIEALVKAIGGEVREGDGSRVVFELKGAGDIFAARTLAKRLKSIKSRSYGIGSEIWRHCHKKCGSIRISQRVSGQFLEIF
jgi:hypothetical protein